VGQNKKLKFNETLRKFEIMVGRGRYTKTEQDIERMSHNVYFATLILIILMIAYTPCTGEYWATHTHLAYN
jgi:hypothetical protein